MGKPGGSAGWAIYHNPVPKGRHSCQNAIAIFRALSRTPPTRFHFVTVRAGCGGGGCRPRRDSGIHARLPGIAMPGSHAVPAALSRVVRMAYAELLHAVSPSQTNGQKSRRPLKGSLVHTQSEIPGFQPNTESNRYWPDLCAPSPRMNSLSSYRANRVEPAIPDYPKYRCPLRNRAPKLRYIGLRTIAPALIDSCCRSRLQSLLGSIALA